MIENMHYWLMKSEPGCYSIDDLERAGMGCWDDVRNYQARNFMRDDMKKDDGVLFYHSSIAEPAIVGLATICREAYPDPTQFEDSDKGDRRATPEKPIWVTVDVRFLEKFIEPLTLNELKLDPFFTDMLVTKRGMRLSVQPVAEKHWKQICTLRSKHTT